MFDIETNQGISGEFSFLDAFSGALGHHFDLIGNVAKDGLATFIECDGKAWKSVAGFVPIPLARLDLSHGSRCQRYKRQGNARDHKRNAVFKIPCAVTPLWTRTFVLAWGQKPGQQQSAPRLLIV